MRTLQAIGIGASSTARIEDVLALISASCDLRADQRLILASIDTRAEFVRELARRLSIDHVLFAPEALRAVQGVTTPSPFTHARLGIWSVAEAAALHALGPAARLVVPRRVGHRCTCALAEIPS